MPNLAFIPERYFTCTEFWVNSFFSLVPWKALPTFCFPHFIMKSMELSKWYCPCIKLFFFSISIQCICTWFSLSLSSLGIAVYFWSVNKFRKLSAMISSPIPVSFSSPSRSSVRKILELWYFPGSFQGSHHVIFFLFLCSSDCITFMYLFWSLLSLFPHHYPAIESTPYSI